MQSAGLLFLSKKVGKFGDGMKKLITVFIAALVLSSCGKINRIMDGTENLPNQINETNVGMSKTNEAIRKQKIGEAFKIMTDENVRKTLTPLPSNMMSAAKTMAEVLTADEAVLFVKNYIIKVNEERFGNDITWEELGLEKFEHNKRADLLMITLISGFLPDETLKEIIKKESEQGAYRDILFGILAMRAYFYNNMMLEAGLIGSEKKLETLGQIEKAIEYNEKIEFVCKLNFADRIALAITGFDTPVYNDVFTKNFTLDKNTALKRWEQIQGKATEEFKAMSFSEDPKENDTLVAEYNQKYKESLMLIQKKISSYSKPTEKPN